MDKMQPKFRSSLLEGCRTEKLSETFGVTKKTIANWKSDNEDDLPKLPTLVKIAEYFKTNLSYCLCLTENSEKLDSYELSKEKCRLLDLLKEEDLSINKFINLTGVSGRTIYKYLDFPNGSSITTVKFTDILDVSPDYLLGLTDKREWENIEPNFKAGNVLKIDPNGKAYYAIVDNNGLIHTALGTTYKVKDFIKEGINYTVVL